MDKETLMDKLVAVFAAILSVLKSKKFWKKFIIIAVIIFVLVKVVGSQFTSRARAIMSAQPVNVEVVDIKTQDVSKSFEFSGRVEAKYTVDLVARIQGFLQKSYFKEGDFVKKGQLLFLIEPSEYEIAVKNAQAALSSTQASLANAEKTLIRAKELVKHDFVSKSYYDDALAQRDLYKGNLGVNKAQLAQAKLNLSYTKITAPVDGKMGKILITQGNLVNVSSGTIAKLISINPIYVTFTLKSEDYLKFKKADPTQDVSNTIVKLKLSDGSEYKQEGKIEFIDNAVDVTSGTITMRATFDNPDGLLVPGDYITVNLYPVNPRHEILVPMEAVQDSDKGLYVYVIENKDKTSEENSEQNILSKVNNKINNFISSKIFKLPEDENVQIVKVRYIKATEQYNNNWVVDDGLKEGDIVVVQGITRLKDKAPVKVTKRDTQKDLDKDVAKDSEQDK